jgi:hypothetical protein
VIAKDPAYRTFLFVITLLRMTEGLNAFIPHPVPHSTPSLHSSRIHAELDHFCTFLEPKKKSLKLIFKKENLDIPVRNKDL